MEKQIAFIINNSEVTAGTRGASLGPNAIITAARNANNDLFGRIPVHPLPDFNFYLDQSNSTPFAKNVDAFEKVFYSVAERTKDLIESVHLPFIIAGDHGSAAGTIAGIVAANPDKKLGVVWIDAHGDLHSPYTTPSGNMHGMPLALSIGTNNEKCARNEVDTYTKDKWSTLSNSFGKTGKVAPENLIFVAVRDTEPEEDAIISEYGITNHTVAEVREKGVSEVLSLIEKQLAEVDIIYVSFDVDSMDPEITSYGTGTPVEDGLTPLEAKDLLIGLAKNPKIICMEVVEVNPCLDNKKNTMAETAFELIQEVVDALKK